MSGTQFFGTMSQLRRSSALPAAKAMPNIKHSGEKRSRRAHSHNFRNVALERCNGFGAAGRAMTITFTMEAEGVGERGDREAALTPDALLPLLAGARARGMSDAFDLLGIAVVMIDEAGMILHANPGARGLLGPHLRLERDHLVAAEQDATRALQAMIGAALAGELPGPGVAIRRDGGRPALRLRALPLIPLGDDACQMLKVVVTLEEAGSFRAS